MVNLFNYDLISSFNEVQFKDLMFQTHVNGDEMFIEKAKDDEAQAVQVKEYFFPMKKDRKSYLLPTKYLRELPVKIDEETKVNFDKKAYHIITDCHPAGFGSQQTFSSFKEFVDNFCNYKHSNKDDFLLWKLVGLTALFKRVNVRVATNPAFGKDSVLRVANGFMGNVSIVNNPTLPKIEYLLNSKVLVTNEIGAIQEQHRRNLQDYYLMCGDFANQYVKRSRATVNKAQEDYDISKLSNVVLYNTLETYQSDHRQYFFDFQFSGAVLNRFMPFKFSGEVLEEFDEVLNIKQIVSDNVEFYKRVVKMLKFIEKNYDGMVHGYKFNDRGFKNRQLRNWKTICMTIDMYAEDQEEYNILCDKLYARYDDYKRSVNEYSGENVIVIPSREGVAKVTPLEKKTKGFGCWEKKDEV